MVSDDANEPFGPQQGWERAVAQAGAASLGALEALEAVARRLHPPELPVLREGLLPLAARVADACRGLAEAAPPPELEPFHRQLMLGVREASEAVALFAQAGDAADAVARVLGAMRGHCRAQEALYPLRHALPPLGRYFAEPAWHERVAELDPDLADGASVGIHATGSGDESGRGGFHLYVPERYTGDREWPLIVALHGGFGEGRDFLWTWLREARSRGVLLLAPTSRDTTWSLNGPDVDAAALVSMLDYVAERWRVDRRRVLLTGLSDGGTYTLLAGLAEAAPYAALAVVSGVLHPRNLAAGNLARAAGQRIYLVHGALDWMFPVALAGAAAESLREAGADVTYREIEDLSHAYPREENARILEWWDPQLA